MPLPQKSWRGNKINYTVVCYELSFLKAIDVLQKLLMEKQQLDSPGCYIPCRLNCFRTLIT